MTNNKIMNKVVSGGKMYVETWKEHWWMILMLAAIL